MKSIGFILILLLILLGCSILYYKTYNSYFCQIGTPSNMAEWGQFGDYMGGLLNPILAIINIAALMYLTYRVSHIEDNRAIENINAQKIITLNQIRYDAVSELSKIMDATINRAAAADSDDDKTKIALAETFFALKHFKENKHYLFEKLFTENFNRKLYDPLMLSVIDLKDVPIVKDEQKIDKIINTFEKAKSEFINEINKYILQELSPAKM